MAGKITLGLAQSNGHLLRGFDCHLKAHCLVTVISSGFPFTTSVGLQLPLQVWFILLAGR